MAEGYVPVDNAMEKKGNLKQDGGHAGRPQFM